MKQKSLKKNAFYSVLKVFLSLVFPLITFPYASRIFLPEGLGKVNFANSIISYFIMLASLGLSAYATREAAKIRDDKQALTKLFKEIISINIICCFIAYILFFVALFLVPKFYDYRSLLLVCSIKILFSVIGIEWLFTAHEEFKYITIRSFIVQILSLIYLFIFVKSKEDILQYAFFGILISVGSNFFNFFLINKYIDIHYHPHLEFKKHFKAITIFFGMNIVTSIYFTLDTTMLGFLSNNAQVGYYTASTKLSHMVLSMLTAITGILLPRLTNYAQNKDTDSLKLLINKSTNILLLLSVPMTFGLIILSKPIILLLSGEQYLPAIPAMRILSPLLIIISFGNLIGVQLLPAIGKEKISFYCCLAELITNAILNSILIPKLGATGAAIGSICAESVVTGTQLIISRKMIFNKDFFITLIESIFASIMMVLAIILLLNFIKPLFLQIMISFICGIICYSIILLILKNKTFIFYTQKFLVKIFHK